MHNPPTPYAWLALRHVCSKWRLAALLHPRLSTIICLTRLECVQDMLQRSGDLPIYMYSGLDFTTHPQSTLDAHQLALANLHRAYRADIKVSVSMFPTLKANVQEHFVASELTSLEMLIFQSDPRNSGTVIRPYFPNMQFPRLTSLSYLYGNIKPFLGMFLPSLRRLRLRSLTPPIPANELLDYLAPLLNLEELELEETLAPANPRLQDLTQIHPDLIALPRLQYISCEQSDALWGAWFISRLKPTNNITLRFIGDDLSEGFCSFTAKMICSVSFHDESSSDAIRSLSLEVDQDFLASLRVWPTVVSLGDMQPRTEVPRPWLELRLKGENGGWPFVYLLSRLPLSMLQVTYLSEMPTRRPLSRRPVPLGSMFQYLSATEVLHIEFHMWDDDTDVITQESSNFRHVRRLNLYEIWHDNCSCLLQSKALRNLVALFDWRDFHNATKVETVVDRVQCSVQQNYSRFR